MPLTHKLAPDPHTAFEQFRFQVGQMTLEDGEIVVVDCVDLRLLDSMLVGQLVGFHVALKKRGIALQLINLSTHARQVLNHSHLDSLFGLTAPEPPRWDTITTF